MLLECFLLADLNSNATLSRMAWETQAVSTNETFQLENFTYSNVVIRNIIFGHLEQTNFRGVSVSEFLELKPNFPIPPPMGFLVSRLAWVAY